MLGRRRGYLVGVGGVGLEEEGGWSPVGVGGEKTGGSETPPLR